MESEENADLGENDAMKRTWISSSRETAQHFTSEGGDEYTPRTKRCSQFRQSKVKSPYGCPVKFDCLKQGKFSFCDVVKGSKIKESVCRSGRKLAGQTSTPNIQGRPVSSGANVNFGRRRRMAPTQNVTMTVCQSTDASNSAQCKQSSDSIQQLMGENSNVDNTINVLSTSMIESDTLSTGGEDIDDDMHSMASHGNQNGIADHVTCMTGAKTEHQSSSIEEWETDISSSQSSSQSSERDSGIGMSPDKDYEERLLSAEGLEIDTILVHNQQQLHLPAAPTNVPKDYKNAPKKRLKLNLRFSSSRPSQSNTLIVTHPYSTDTELGDYFGATCETTEGREFNCHTFTKVIPDTPASIMSIMNGDEIVLFNNEFAPGLSHTDVLNLFHHVKVDGQTPFILVIRRKEKGKKSWQWYESTAVLAPDTRKHRFPAPEKVTFTPLKDNEKHFISHHQYKVDPSSHQFLCIEASRVGVRTLQHDDKDRSTIITKAAWVTQAEGGAYRYSCQLCSESCGLYLGVDKNTKTVLGKKDPTSFEWKKDGQRIYFQYKGVFLAVNGQQVTCSSKQHMFEEFPAFPGEDQCDLASSVQSNTSVDSGYVTPTNGRSLKRNESIGLSSPIDNLRI